MARSRANIHLLLPPGAPVVSDPSSDGSADGDGLWTQVRWARGPVEPIIDLDPPTAVRHVRTIHVLAILGERHHARVRALVELQIAQARLLMRPTPGGAVDDRQAQHGARLLLGLEQEVCEAFADADVLLRLDAEGIDVNVPDSCQELLERIPTARSPPPDREVGVRELGGLLLSALARKLLPRRPALMTSDLPRAFDEGDDGAGRELAEAVS